MIAIIKTSHNRRSRDIGRFALVIGKGTGKRVFHLSPAEVKKLANDAGKAMRNISTKSFSHRFPTKP